MSGRIFFIDPSLGADGGHHLITVVNYAKLCAPLGRELVFIGNRNADATARATLPHLHGVFTHSVHDAFRVARYGKSWMAHVALVKLAQAALTFRPRARDTSARVANPGGEAFSPEKCRALLEPLGAARALQTILSRHTPTRGDHLVFLNVDPAVICAFRADADWRAPEATLHVHFMYPESEAFGEAMRAGLLQTYREALAGSDRIHLYAESRPHASWLADELGKPVALAPTPTRVTPLPDPPTTPIVAALLGAGRRDKGFDRAPDIVAALRTRAPELRVRIQGAPQNAGLEDVERRLRHEAAVTLLPPHLSAEDYEQELARAHILLLPYDPDIFMRRNSGVLADALFGGRPFVCTRGSALEAAIVDGNGLAASTAGEFADALASIASNYPTFLAAAKGRSKHLLAELADGPFMRALSN